MNPQTHQHPKGKRPFRPHQPRNTQASAQTKILPGEAFMVPADSRSKKSFPFATPIQAYRRTYVTPEMKVKPIAHETLRIIPLGGLEQVGLNCIAFEYEDEILIIDAGLQFPDQYQLGINFSIPDMAYMKGKKIVGVAITHGHLDHIGAMPYLIRQLGKGTPIYATPMALELIKLRQEEHNLTLSNAIEYERNKLVQIGKYFRVTPFTVDHSMPDCVGLSIETPVGRFVHTGDWKFDSKPLPFRPSTDYKLLETFGNLGVRALLSDSTNAYLFGASISESEVIGSLEEIFRESSGRIITATFSSIIDRIMLIVSVAEKFGRKVALLGRGMNNYMDIAVKRGYAQPKPGTIIDMEALNKLPDEKVVICCTGAQGERYAALMRMTTGESQDTALKPTDTVVFSSSVIPGNERAVQSLFDLIAMQ
jgi:ribonuclease J